MASFNRFLQRPRYLRAIPSLVVLTTAMAWGDLPDADGLDEVDQRATVTQTQRTEDLPAPPVPKQPLG